MVSQYPPQKPEVMRMRMRTAASGTVTSRVPVGPEDQFAIPVPPPWRIVISAPDGVELLVMREQHGRLVVEGDESRWDEGARRFVHSLMQWSGQAGIAWKDEARKAGEDGR